MPELDLEKNGDVFVVTLDNPSTGNAINTASLSAHREILAELETVKENSAVVVTSSDPKSWCVGLDFDWIREQSEQEFGETFREVEEVFERWALLSLPTIACITGHCIAGGAFLASVMDFRLMRADRGWFAFTEIDVKIPPSPKLYLMADLLPNKQAVRELLLTGRRVGEMRHKNWVWLMSPICRRNYCPVPWSLLSNCPKKTWKHTEKSSTSLNEILLSNNSRIILEILLQSCRQVFLPLSFSKFPG